ncbi:MAG: MAE_28990/MAE_18760 family HEPN-like nuclease [Bacteroidales bacterium]
MSNEEFENLMFDEWTWRRKELTQLILIAEHTKEKVLYRSIILLLYAHWEGYIKKACRIYLYYIISNKYKISSLQDNFKALCLKGFSREVLKSSESLNLTNEMRLVSMINEVDDILIDKKLKVNLNNDKEKDLIDTHDNLNPKVLQNILSIIGLSYKEEYENKKMYIETYLLANRNAIAHGNKEINQDFELEISKLKELRDVICTIIENIRDEIVYFAKNEFYLKDKNQEKEDYLKMKDENLTKELKCIEDRYKN